MLRRINNHNKITNNNHSAPKIKLTDKCAPKINHIGEQEIKIKSLNKKNKEYPHTCPKCGEGGEDLMFKFYCSNENCENYHE